jgi:hypothetical protein
MLQNIYAVISANKSSMSRYFIFIAKEEVDKPLDGTINAYSERNISYMNVYYHVGSITHKHLTPVVAEVVSETIVDNFSIVMLKPKIIGTYDLFKYDTIKTFGLHRVCDVIIRFACKYNRTDFLQEVKDCSATYDQSTFEHNAAFGGNINVLEWCKNNGFVNFFRYANILDMISCDNYMEILTWCINNGYKNIVFTERNEVHLFQIVIATVIRRGFIDLLELFYTDEFGMNFKQLFQQHVGSRLSVLYPVSGVSQTHHAENIMKFLNWIEKTDNVKFLDNRLFTDAVKVHDINVAEWCRRNGMTLNFPFTFFADTTPESVAMFNWIMKNNHYMQFNTIARDVLHGDKLIYTILNNVTGTANNNATNEAPVTDTINDAVVDTVVEKTWWQTFFG